MSEVTGVGVGQEPDYNLLLDDILQAEDKQEQSSYEEGVRAGRQEGNPEGYHLGYHRGAELGAELGYYLGVVTYHLSLHNTAKAQYADKIVSQLSKVERSISRFPRTNSEHHDLLGEADTIRAQYKKTCALLKIDSRYPFGAFTMESRMTHLRRHIDRITRYLKPLLPLANCHTVEYLTEGLWECHIPLGIRREVESGDLEHLVEAFWSAAEGGCDDSTAAPQLLNFVREARAHCLSADGIVCLTRNQVKERLRSWGGRLEREVDLKEFVSPKKRYEVREMSWLVSTLCRVARSTHCIELGGGKGYLSDALAHCHALRTLTVDCDEVAITGGKRRTDKMKKLLPTLMPQSVVHAGSGSHRYATMFVNRHSDLVGLVKEMYPEDFIHGSAARLLLTGLHTCGNLGPDCLRIFAAQASVAAVCNVPCCYHLLTEGTDGAAWSCFERDFGDSSEEGFPMSDYLREYQLGRNARMLAAQSIDRMVAERTVPSVGLHYRAILQVLLKEHVPKREIAEGKLKGVAAKCHNFEQYFKMASDRLGLGFSVSSDVEETYKNSRKSLVMFYFLRLCVAQVVESLILLDRLMFMYESGFGERTFIVKLFEGAKSPRCHAIVALR